jgi:hypothetical protein
MVGRGVFLDGNCIESYPNERMKNSKFILTPTWATINTC